MDHICRTFVLFSVFSFDVSWPAHFLSVSPDHGVIQPWYVFMHLNLDTYVYTLYTIFFVFGHFGQKISIRPAFVFVIINV